MIGAGMSAPRHALQRRDRPPPPLRLSSAPTSTTLKRVKDAHGGTVNDVILSVVAGALGNYLRARGHDTEGLELRAMVPVSVRADEEHGALGNRISAMMAPLPVWCEDPVERLHLVTETMGDLKGSGQAVGAEILTKLDRLRADRRSPRRPPACSRRSASSTSSSPTSPGRSSRSTCSGRKMESIFPMVPLARRQALCVGIMSYNGQVNFGLIGDYDAMADLDSFGLDLEGAIARARRRGRRRQRRRSAQRAAPRPRNGALSVK